jgi:phosphoribosylglycinamide formyltransferase-1
MLGIFTYEIPHRKTYDTLCLLRAKGITDEVIVFANPLHYKKKFSPLISHRPISTTFLTTKELCENLNFNYIEGFEKNALPKQSKILLCGAGIIEQDIINTYRIINAHPGYLPNVRGLDALKWAIYDQQPIGVTTHQLGDFIDAGLIIERKMVPLNFNDTFHAVAQRQYEMEVNMLVDAIDKIDSAYEYIEPQNFPLKKRMPHEFETRVFSRFNKMVDKITI